MSVINDPKDTKQEGLLIHMRMANCHGEAPATPQAITLFLDKYDCARIAKTTQQGKQYWKRFRLPKMVHQ